MISYQAKIVFNRSDKAYLVEFPDLPGCITYGYSLQEAKINAQEALSVYLESIDQRSEHIPSPSRHKGRNFHSIKPDKSVAFAIWLKKQRQTHGLTQKDIAHKLGISYQTYQRFEDPAKSNPTLKTIHKLETVFNKELLTV